MVEESTFGFVGDMAVWSAELVGATGGAGGIAPMMTSMAAVVGRLALVMIACALALAACSDNGDDLPALPSSPIASTSPTTSTSAPATTSTRPPASTTLSDLEAAEAEVAQVVIDWTLLPIDSSLGEEGLGVQYLTGLIRQRTIEALAQFQADGLFLRSARDAEIDIVSIQVDLGEGFAEVQTCMRISEEFVDLETLDVISTDDPERTTTADFQVQLTADGWRISEWLPSAATVDPIDCEVGE